MNSNPSFEGVNINRVQWDTFVDAGGCNSRYFTDKIAFLVI
jgi:hypothetical protein